MIRDYAMKKYFLFLFTVLVGNKISAVDNQLPLQPLPLESQHTEKALSKAANNVKKMITFSYKDEPLLNIVNEIASALGLNLLYPEGPNALVGKVTFTVTGKISLAKAWHYVLLLLKISGFVLIPHEECSFIVKKSPNIVREPFPLYVNIPLEDLPKSNVEIRYLKYLSNLQIHGEGGAGSVQQLLQDLLPSDNQLILDPQSNAVLITDYAPNIKGALEIIEKLDAYPGTQSMKVLKLKNILAAQLKLFLDQLLSKSATGETAQQLLFGIFVKNISYVVEPRTNSVVLLGKEKDIEKVVQFITSSIDVPLSAGQSVLHIYDLQYLDAQTFAGTLSQIVQNQTTSSTGQSTSTGPATGTEQYFSGVIITAEVGGGTSTDASQTGSQSGNRLIIAATKNDWIRLEKLIKQLDKPQPQVVFHGIIVDITDSGQKNLAAQLRNYGGLFVKNVNFQTAHMGNDNAGIEVETGGTSTAPTNPNALQANLLSATSSTGTGNIGSQAVNGSFIMSFTDPNTNGIWLITSILRQLDDSKILAQPFLTTLNNKQVQFSDKETRFIAGEASQQFGVSVQNQLQKTADLTLNILPRISSGADGKVKINLVIDLAVNEWVSATDQSQTNRSLKTSVNVEPGQVIVCGGLSKSKIEHSVSKTPFFGDLIGIGNLFKNKSKIVTRNNLMFFLRAEIIYPPKDGRMNAPTKRKFDDIEKWFDSDDHEVTQRDPITRWFFGTDANEKGPQGILSDYRQDTHVISGNKENHTIRFEPQEKTITPTTVTRVSNGDPGLATQKMPGVSRLMAAIETDQAKEEATFNKEMQKIRENSSGATSSEGI